MDQLKVDFNKVIESLKLSEKSVNSRKENFNQFIENGFPNKRAEDWKFSDLKQIISSNIENLRFHTDLEISQIDEATFIDKFVHNKIIFLNGVISKVDFSSEDDTKVLITRDLNQNENSKEINSLVSLNNALIASYIRVTVKENYSMNEPLIIYNITTKELKSTAINLKTDIVLEKNSSLKLIDLFDDSSENNFINIVQNFDIAQDAILKNYKIDHKKNSNIKYLSLIHI